jgi:hypothetical protein
MQQQQPPAAQQQRDIAATCCCKRPRVMAAILLILTASFAVPVGSNDGGGGGGDDDNRLLLQQRVQQKDDDDNNNNDDGTDDIEWTRWATVVARGHLSRTNSAPTWMFNDSHRDQFLADLRPDILDFLDSLQADRGEYFRRHGVAVSAGSGYEYDQSFGFSEVPEPSAFVKAKFESFGVQQDEHGELIWQPNWNAYGMTHFGPLWRRLHLSGGIPRRAGYGDAVVNDNIGDQYTLRQNGWSNATAVSFAQWLLVTNRSDVLPRAPYNRQTFVRDTVASLRANGTDPETLIRHPLIRELSRFVITMQTQHWLELAQEARRVASAKAFASRPAVWGNQAGLWTSRSLHNDNTSGYTRAGSLIVGQASDVVWTELSGPLAGTLNDTASLAYKILETSAGTRARFACRYPTTSARFYVASAEAAANNVVLSQVLDDTAGPGTPTWQMLSKFNSFATDNSWLLVDRQRLTDVGIAYSLPSILWRSFSTTSLYRTPQFNSSKLACHLSWLSKGAQHLDEEHVMMRASILGQPGVYPDQLSLDETTVLILPGVDAVSDSQVRSISAWVRAGGHLVLLGDDSAAFDEELNLRPEPAFCAVCAHCPSCPCNSSADAGRGSVDYFGTSSVESALSKLSAMIDRPLVHTNAGNDVYINAFAHGQGIANHSLMRSVHFVHYTDTSNITQKFGLSMRDVPATSTATFFTPEAPSGVILNVSAGRVGTGYRHVEVPPFLTYGVLVFAHQAEMKARRTAAQLRRLMNRITVASRCRGVPARGVTMPDIKHVKALLSSIQGANATTSVSVDFDAVLPELTALLEQASSALQDITQNHIVAANRSLVSVLTPDLQAVARFDFGPVKPMVNASADGWVRISQADMCGRRIGAPNASLSACWSLNESEIWFIEERTQSQQHEQPVFSTAIRSNATASVSLSGLEPDTPYNITLLCGAYQYYLDAAYSQVVVDEPVGGTGGMFGDTSESGSWQHRCFTAKSNNSGGITMRLGSTNTGPFYQSTYNPLFHTSLLDRRGKLTVTGYPDAPPVGSHFVSWMASGLIVQSSGQALTALAEKDRLKNEALSRAALRHWSLIGPFNTPNYSFTRFGPEKDFDLSKSFRSHFNDRVNLRWRSVQVNGSLPLLDLRTLLGVRTNEMQHAVSFAITFVRGSKSSPPLERAVLRYSTSQAAVVTINGKVVGHKFIGTGVKARDASVALGPLNATTWTQIMIRSECFWGNEWGMHAGLFKDDGTVLLHDSLETSACGPLCGQ